MSLLDDLKGQVEKMIGGEGEASPVNPEALINHVMTSLQSTGVGEIVEKLKANGLESVVGSWLGQGENQPLSIEHLKDAIGADKIQELASKAGVSFEQYAGVIKEALPKLVDKLSPGGTLEENDWLAKGLDFLKSHTGQ